jgi:brefeldin A-inhibited guanine nucleotide-exchange protein
MEKFGEVYCRQNPNHDHLKSPDTVFVLAYSTIMLNTDLHSPQIKNKMTKPQFLNTNRGISKTEEGDRDLDPSFLGEIYDTILRDELKMQNRLVSVTTDAASNPKQKQSLFAKETELIVRKSEEIFKQTNKGRRVHKHLDEFVTSSDPEHVRAIIEVCWCPVLATLSLMLEKSDDMSIVHTALHGVGNAIHICSRFFLDTERDAFVGCLSKLTNLHMLKEISLKNIDAIKTLLDVAREDGNFLQQSWYEVLRSISQLQKLQLLSAGAHSDAEFLIDDSSAASAASQATATATRLSARPLSYAVSLSSAN